MVETKHQPPAIFEQAVDSRRLGRRYSLSLDEVKALQDQGNVIPIYRELIADLETPVSAYLKIAEGPYSFLLESVEGGQLLARYSFIGADPYLTVQTAGRCCPGESVRLQAGHTL